MFLIKGYYYIFYGFIILLVGVCEAIHWLRRPRFTFTARKRLNYRNLASILHLELKQGAA